MQYTNLKVILSATWGNHNLSTSDMIKHYNQWLQPIQEYETVNNTKSHMIEEDTACEQIKSITED
eukprot:5052633-Amphidinium_carterae.1